MLAAPVRQEIDHRTIKLIVGLIALTLAGLTGLFAGFTIDSISASYYVGGWSQTIFIGFLFAIAAFLLAYNGTTRWEMALAKVAAAAAAGVALFPCSCGGHKAVPYVHGISAAVMFLILAFFSYGFYRRARDKNHTRANIRAVIYALCSLAIVLAILALGYDSLFANPISNVFPQFTYFGEATGLIAFGISWLLASRVLPGLTAENERFSPLRADNPN
jgi:hypothetical protein